MSAARDLSDPPPPGKRRFQVLALSGGGVRGLYTASVLEGLEARAGAPLHRCFDLVAGTSIGGIIALGLALGRSAADVRALVERAGPLVFPPRVPVWGSVRNLFRARHDAAPLRAIIEEVVGADTRIGDLATPVLVPTVALNAGAAQTLRSPHHAAHALDADVRLVDAAMATAAAPVLLPFARIGDAEYLDGGLAAHAPDALALHEAQVFFGRRRADVFMLGVGTTQSLSALAAGGEPSRGLLWWMARNRLAETVMAAQQALSQQIVREALGERYLCIDSALSREQARVVGLDRADARAIATLKALARHALERAVDSPRLPRFLAHRAAPPAG